MDSLTFITSLTGALAWPAAVVSIALVFRKSLVALLPSLRELEYGNFKLKFERELTEAFERADRAELPEPERVVPTPATGEREWNFRQPVDDTAHDLTLLAAVSPRAAVLQAWIEVEQALRDAMRDLGQKTWRRRSEPNALLEAERISHETAKLINELRALRNEAAHQPDFALDGQQALDYALLARRVVAAVRGASVPSAIERAR